MKELYKQMGNSTKFAAKITLITVFSLILTAYAAEFSGVYIYMKVTAGLLAAARSAVFIGLAFVLAINWAEKKQ